MTEITASNENRALAAARMLREHYSSNREKYSADWVLIHAVRDQIKLRPEASPEDLFRQLATPSKTKSPGLMSRYVVASFTSGLDNARDQARGGGDIFSGGQEFSFGKIAAMAAYFARRSKKVCKIKLNQLLFYSDFVNYFAYGRSMSGAKYVRTLTGPMIERYDSTLKNLLDTGVLKEKDNFIDQKEFIVLDEPSIHPFLINELVTLHWVHANFGNWTGSEILEYSRRESVYRFTRQDEYIAYEYSRFLQKMPDSNLQALFAA